MKSGIWKKVIIVEIILLIALCGALYTGNTFSREEVDLKVNDTFMEYVGAECEFLFTSEDGNTFLYEGTVAMGEAIKATVEYEKLPGGYNITKIVYVMDGNEGSAEVTRLNVAEFIGNLIMIVAAGDLIAWFIISWRKGTLGEQKVFGRKKKEETDVQVIKKAPKGPTL